MARSGAVARWCPMLPPREVTLNQQVGGSSPPRPTKLAGGRGAPGQKRVKGPALIQPILLFELARQVFLGEVLEVLVGEGVQFVFEPARERSEEHTSELQSHSDLVCRLLLEKKK